jgi:threonine dehydratase
MLRRLTSLLEGLKRSGSDGDYAVTYADIVRAKYRLQGKIHRTPLSLSRTFSEMAKCSVYMKLENLQKTGAFKVRGALNRIAQLDNAARARGVITASAGNHAQGVALAAREAGIASTIVMPAGAPEAKIMATQSYGSRVVLHGGNYDEAYEKACEIAAHTGSEFIHAFDDPHVIAGQGTIGIELLEDMPQLDAVLVPVGGGGLIAGIALAVKTVRPETMIIGVQPETANSGFLSWKHGSMQTIDRPASIADGLSVRKPGHLPLELMNAYVDDFVTVSEHEIRRAMFYCLERSKLLVEGAGAAALAALLSGRLDVSGKRVALIVSGGNVDVSRLADLYRPAPASSPLGEEVAHTL